ncbi:protein translocase subunit SecD [Pseudoalteromonas ardens]|uniref:Protein translocase subunit SecD n=1 Tax=Pseudoalteromonas rubra TaxID=43658 RepID=A0A0L0EXP9_9GAMM|nr:protein translocase subunit SecD [Pseudoalteromonas sp. R96]KNC69195.1 preprotein translocase subunit SecD [Pseudoalteromonas rubra]MDK1311858.1 protein translocase subunit SecD [Pseudoalteromonas sp. R96]
MNRKTNAARTVWPARLKRLLVVAVILVLGLCAMPNLYQNKTQLSISALPQAQTLPSPDTLVHLLQSHGFSVAQIGSGEPTLVTLTSQTASASAQAVLAEALRDQATVKVVEQATAPYWLQRLGLSPIKLGLDLNGGVLFVLKVDTDKALEKRMENIALEAKSQRIRDKLKGVRIERSSVAGLELVALPQGAAALQQLQTTLLAQFQHLSVQTHKHGNLLRATLSYDEAGKAAFEKQTMTQALTTLRSRIEELGITEAVTQRQGANYIRIELPGVQDPAAAKRIIGATAQLSFHALQEFGGKRVKAEHGIVGLDPLAIFTGADIDSAQAGRDEYGKPLVQLFLSSRGGDKMLRFSRANVGEPMATMYSEYIADSRGDIRQSSQVISVATIQQVLGQRFSITNLGSWQKAQDLALLLRAGSLDAPLTIVTERTIGPNLGAQNIASGFGALALGLSLTLGFMLLWYRKLGVIACMALVANLVCLVGLMSLLPGVVLTLPGIAGLVLTIGMAVDTNVIIFERIKEERRQGSSMRAALQRGYQQAQSSIIDANLTTMITALVLMSIGYGPVKGFAITLALGIITSMFCGVVVSGQLSQWFYRTKSAKGA